jgi:hypothetical protein
MVNDVERFRSYFNQGRLVDGQFIWERTTALLEYFWFGHVSISQALEYTNAEIWNIDGSWISVETT